MMYLLYFGMAIYFAMEKTRNIGRVMKMCGCYWMLHVSYGMGSLLEFIDFKSKRVR